MTNTTLAIETSFKGVCTPTVAYAINVIESNNQGEEHQPVRLIHPDLPTVFMHLDVIEEGAIAAELADRIDAAGYTDCLLRQQHAAAAQAWVDAIAA